MQIQAIRDISGDWANLRFSRRANTRKASRGGPGLGTGVRLLLAVYPGHGRWRARGVGGRGYGERLSPSHNGPFPEWVTAVTARQTQTYAWDSG